MSRTALLLSSVLSVSLLLAVLALRPARSPERATDPAHLVERAAAAIRDARAAGAVGRAPATLARAEEAYRDGLVEQRRQELRPRLLRDYRAAHAALGSAEAYAARAGEVALRSVARDRAAGSEAVRRVVETLAVLRGVEDRVWLGPELRTRLQRARTLASDASSLLASGAYVPAAERAAEGLTEARTVSASVLELTARYADEAHLSAWREWVAETVAWSARTGRPAIVVDKDAHRLTLYERGRAVRTWNVELGWNNAADKRRQGDGATPEGRYRVTEMKGRGRSRYHKALLIDYPNRQDLATLAELKRSGQLPRSALPGGLIEIHGEGGRGRDWTDGCVALTNAEVDDLFARVSVGTPVTIVGGLSGRGAFADVARELKR